MKRIRLLLPVLCFLLLAAPPLPAAPDAVILLNVSADTTRSFYKNLNALFAASWKRDTDQDVTVDMAHNGSTLEAKAVLGGLDADVVTLNQETDMDLLAASKQHLISSDWRTAFPNESVPFESTVMFLVRAGNPKAIKDWDDLVKPGVRIVMPNPKTSGNGRYGYLAAWTYALRHNEGDEGKARDFVRRMFKNVAVLDVGGDSASTSFARSQIGDVLVTFESEAYRIRHDSTLDGGQFLPVMPSLSILARLPVAIVDPNTTKHGTRPVAQAYLQFLYSPAAQELAAKSFFRPTDKDVLAHHADEFKPVETVDVQAVFGGWAKAQQVHFKDGAIFDQIYEP